MSSIEERMIKMLGRMIEELKEESEGSTTESTGSREALAAQGVHMSDSTAHVLEETKKGVAEFKEQMEQNLSEYQEQVLHAVGMSHNDVLASIVAQKRVEAMRRALPESEAVIEVGEEDLTVDCVWCGKALEKSDAISVRAHTMVCEEHPMRALEREILGLQAQVRAMGHELNIAATRADQLALVSGKARVLLRDAMVIMSEDEDE